MQRGEGPTIEFKKNLLNSIDLAKDLAAFSNGCGGYIILGIDDKNGHLIGESVTKDWILAVARTKCNPKIIPTVEEIIKAEKKIILITVHEGDAKPYLVENKCYLRDNTITRLATQNEESDINVNKPTQKKTLNFRQMTALEYVKENGMITNMIYRDLFDISHKTAHLELTDLLKQELLMIVGKGRSTNYTMLQTS